ncbi:MAG: enoyl-CoA hydratase/isomerase family protein [Thermoflexaceae bacterium]|nr:enoyl-CoA hydratase/isomerase family protein [Thermoflexaceae bacterium]
MPDCIIETTPEGVRLIRLNRPERLNTMGGTLIASINDAFRSGEQDDSVRAYVVVGEGRAWCAGADLKDPAVEAFPGAGTEGRRAEAIDYLGGAGRTVLTIARGSKPVIAAINGVTVGGGLGLALCMDIRIASEEARFSTVFISRGLAPDFGLSWFLPRLVGPERAAEMFFTARMIDAQEALRIGMVSRVVPHAQLLDEAMALARKIASQPPSALTYTRRDLQYAMSSTLEQHLEYEWANQRLQISSPEFREGLAAFLERREPDWGQAWSVDTGPFWSQDR